jgi:two-component system sensor histidine kinase KdpD
MSIKLGGEALLAVADHLNPTQSEQTALGVTEVRRMRSALLDSISLDVGKPLALIAGAAMSLKNRGSAPKGSTQVELISIIENEAERLERFVSILLDMARLEFRAVEMRMETVDLGDVIRVTVRDIAKTSRDRKLGVILPASLGKLRLDREILRRVLFILVENAARQTPPGSKVSVQAGRDATAVRIQIMDEGDGIPPADINGMFNQFRLPCTDDRSSSTAGMHLAVCRGYVEAMGGTISGSNRTDRSGAVFTITFPEAAQTRASAVVESREPVEPMVPGGM